LNKLGLTFSFNVYKRCFIFFHVFYVLTVFIIFLADRTNGRTIATLLRLSSVCL